MEYKDLLGGKGANLAEMTSVLKLPVPPGFTISTDACRDYMHGGWPEGLDEEIAKQVFKLEKAMGRKLGDPSIHCSCVRSRRQVLMPGMMDRSSTSVSTTRVSRASRVRPATNASAWAPTGLIAMCGRMMLSIDGERHEDALDAAKEKAGAEMDDLIPPTR